MEAYSALLLAFLSTERLVCFLSFCVSSFFDISSMQNFFAVRSKSIRDAIADCLPDRSLAILVPVLDRFVVCVLTSVLFQ